MFFRRMETAPTPNVIRRLAHNGDANALPSNKFLTESTQLLESLQAAINIAFNRSLRQLQVLAYGGQRPDALELFRNELGALHDLLEEIGNLDPPFSPIEVGRQLRAFATGEDR